MLESQSVKLETEGARVRPENGRGLAAHDDVWDLLDALDLQLFERVAAAQGGGTPAEARAGRCSGCGQVRGRDLEWL